MYTLLVCSDLWGQKENLEVVFPSIPSMAELITHIESVFSYESIRLRPPNIPDSECHFRVTRLQIYDDAVMRWVELTTPSQLHDFDQLYAFQRTSPWHIDVQKDLPPPRAPALQRSFGSSIQSGATPMTMTATPNTPAPPLNQPPQFTPASVGQANSSYQSQINRSPNNNVVPPISSPLGGPSSSTAARPQQLTAMPGGYPSAGSLQNIQAPPRPIATNNSINLSAAVPHVQDTGKLKAVFENMDKTKNSYISLANFTEGLTSLGIRFTNETCKDMFSCYSKGKAYLSYSDFCEWGEQYPNVVEACNHRIGDRQKEQQLREQLRLCQQQGALQRQRFEDLSRELEAVKQETMILERRAKENEDKLKDMTQHRATIEQQEQVLLDKELRLAFQREELRRYEMDFRETARGFDRVAEAWGSPRRSRPI
eukprot:PhF_6_TR20846/c0_g1_i1/m.30029